MTKKNVDAGTGEAVEELVGFRPAPVFADSQLADLEERPLPSPYPALPDDAEALYHTVHQRVERAGIAVEERGLPAGIQGVSQGGRIVLRVGLDSRSRLLTLIHEVVHEVAHHGSDRPEQPRQAREFAAESVAYVVAAALGVEHPGARDYLLAYRGTAEQLKSSLGEVQRLVRRVLAIVGDEVTENGGRKAAA